MYRGIVSYIGAGVVLRSVGAGRLVILNYHSVVPDECVRDPMAYGNAIGVSEFSRQMSEVARWFHPLSASDLKTWNRGDGHTTRRPVLVTFDDGYRNNLTEAAPVLLRLGIPALIHLSTGYIGTKRVLWPDEIYWRVLEWPRRVLPSPDTGKDIVVPRDVHRRRGLASDLREACKRLPKIRLEPYLARLREEEVRPPSAEVSGFLSWDEVRTLRNQGFEIGSHTVEHPILTEVSEEDAASELTDSKRTIERELGRPCEYFAYPNGGQADISVSVVKAVGRAGYRFAFAVTGLLADRECDPLALDRVYVPGDTSMADFLLRSSGLRGTLKASFGIGRSGTVPRPAGGAMA